jgi:hypothetical protein
MDKLLAVLREQALDKKPTVDELKKTKGLENVTAKERDEAWKKYQEEQQAETSGNGQAHNAGTDDGAGNDGADQDNGADADKNQTTTTTPTTDSKPNAKPKAKQDDSPRYRVTVKRDGFRRLGRAWTGSTEVALSDDELAALEVDPMFHVDEL